jgi:hypothetical protein
MFDRDFPPASARAAWLDAVELKSAAPRNGRKRAVLVCIALQFHIGNLVQDTS